jgi:predicted nucleic acid-binding Zn ribbon protein
MARKINRLSVTLVQMLKAQGLESRLQEYRVIGQWEKAVGKVIARHAQPCSLRGKKMTLVVDSPAWMQQLTLLKPEIVEKVNRRLGHNAIRDIMLKLGEVAQHEGEVSEDLPVRADLDRDEREKIESALQDLHDPEIREAVRRVMEKDFLRRKRLREK